jgi:hypothetical protein
MATTAFALPGDPPIWGGNCDPEAEFNVNDPDFPVPIPLVHKMINDEGKRLFKAKIDPYLEVDPKTGEKSIYRGRHQPQVDVAGREVEEWKRRVKDRSEKYIEVDPCNKGLVIRAKYVDLIW